MSLIPDQRPAVDVGDGWAGRLEHAERELAAARADAGVLQEQVNTLRDAVIDAHDVLDCSPLPPSRQIEAAARILNTALSR